jgi:hypothetical protein
VIFRAKMNNFPRDIRRNSIKQFLNSLVPNILIIYDVQLRTYNKRYITLKEDILGTNPFSLSPVTFVEVCVEQFLVRLYLSSLLSEDEIDRQNYLSLQYFCCYMVVGNCYKV